MKFTDIAAVVMDMDGVLWRGEEEVPGVPELFSWLHMQNIPYALATNNSSKTPADYVAKLARFGVEGVPPERIITSSIATASYMQTRYLAGARVYVLGMHGLRDALTEAGFDIVPLTDFDPVEVVVSGIDFELTYDKLKHAALLIRAGADFIGTNGDFTFPTGEGEVPGAGSILAALQAATGQTPVVVGKPHPPMFQAALAMVGTPPERTLMIGDRLDTDIQGARAVGMATVLVLTGVTRPEDMVVSDVWADVAYEDLTGVIRAWAGEEWYRAQVKQRRGR